VTFWGRRGGNQTTRLLLTEKMYKKEHGGLGFRFKGHSYFYDK